MKGKNSLIEGLSALEYGDPRRPTVLLLHGIGHQAAVWESLAQALANRWHCVALDLPGHGCAGRESEPSAYGFERILAAQSRAVTALGQPEAIVGHSLGGRLALRLAVTQPVRLRGLVIIEYSPFEEEAREQDILKMSYLAEDKEFKSHGQYREYLMENYPLVPEKEILNLSARALKRVPKRKAYVQSFDPKFLDGYAQHTETVESGPFSAIADRSLLIRGKISGMVSKRSLETLCSEMGIGTTMKEIDFAGHNPMLENPGACNRAIVEFIDGLEGTGLA